MATIHTIGHSTRTLEELMAALKAHNIGMLVDIRAFPMSRRLPHFNRESLEQELPKGDIAYNWMKELGGRRRKILENSPNTGLRNESFRNYADYMLTQKFAQAIESLLRMTEGPTLSATGANERGAPASSQSGGTAGPSAALGMANQSGSASPGTKAGDASPEERPPAGVAIMCAERVYFQCHRMLVSDYLTAHGHTVLHIDDDKRPVRPHKLMAEAHLVDGKVVYNAQQLF
jgi:uncharacterized protein (DUF488 family)